MSSRTPVEHDFIGLSASSAAGTADQPTSSILGLRTSAIARIDTEVLRRVLVGEAPAPAGTAPLTVFYNGSVAVFDVSHHKAEAIIWMATDISAREGPNRGKALVGNFAKDLPLARTKSLQRFLEKRKERFRGKMSI